MIYLSVAPKVFTSGVVAAGKPNENLTVKVPFYENPNYNLIQLMINKTQLLNTTNQQTTNGKYELTTTGAQLNQSITGYATVFNGSRLDLSINYLAEADFTSYLIRVVNVLGIAVVNVTLRAKSKYVVLICLFVCLNC